MKITKLHEGLFIVLNPRIKILKLKTINILGILFMMSIIFTSCNPNDDADGLDNSGGLGEISIDQGANIQRDFMGKIVNESNVPVENVLISIGSKTANTDANGMFIIKNADVKERQGYIIAEKTGYIKGMRTVLPTEGTNNIQIILVAENIIATVATGASSEVSLPNGAKVTFDGNFKDSNGNAYSGNVAVMMYHLDPSNSDIEKIMPGNLQAVNENGDERLLESYGMMNVELRGDSGQELNIADGHVATIEMPMDPAQSGVAPTTIPLWHFDEVEGIWVEDGEATLIGGVYVGEVSHFSWWNCDAQFPTVELCMTIVDNINNPLSGVRVELWRSGAIYPRIGISNAVGEICGLIPSNETLILKVYDQCGVAIHNTSIGPFSTNTNYGNVVLASVTSSTITGNLVNCSNNNVTNGYVELNYGTQYTSVDVINGAFTLNIIQCASMPEFNLEGFDYDTLQTTTIIPFNFTNANVGNLIACTTVTEYMTIQIDSDPVQYFLTNINAGSNGSMININAQGASNNYFSTGGDTSVLGTYSFTTPQSFWLESGLLNLDYNIPNTIQFTLNNYGSIGQYIDMTISGNYTDNNGDIKSISGTVHVLRDY